METHKEPTRKLLKPINDFSKISGYKFNKSRLEVTARGWSRGGKERKTGSYCLIGTEYLF